MRSPDEAAHGKTALQVEHWCPEAQKMTTLNLEAVHKTRIGMEAGEVTACKNQHECRGFRRIECLVGKVLEGRFL